MQTILSRREAHQIIGSANSDLARTHPDHLTQRHVDGLESAACAYEFLAEGSSLPEYERREAARCRQRAGQLRELLTERYSIRSQGLRPY